MSPPPRCCATGGGTVMTEDYESLVHSTIRELMRRLDEAALEHHQTTGHQFAVMQYGYRCVDCDTIIHGSLRVVGFE